MLTALSSYLARPSWHYTTCYPTRNVYSHVYANDGKYLYHLCSSFDRDDFNTILGNVLFSGVPRSFVQVGGSTNSVEDRGQRKRGSGGGSPLVSGSGGSCNLIQEISFHIVKFFLIFGTLRLFTMTTNLFFIDNEKQLRT